MANAIPHSHVRRVAPDADKLATLRRLRRLARLLDSSIGIPGTKFRFGLDGIIGLIPGGGDLATALISAWIIKQAVDIGTPKPVIARMIANVGIDLLVGAVPVLGDLFDIVWKANNRNVDLLIRVHGEPGEA